MIRMADLEVPYWSDPLVGGPQTALRLPVTAAINSHMIVQYNEEQEIEQ